MKLSLVMQVGGTPARPLGIEMAAGHVWKPAPLMRHAPLNAVAEMFVAIFEGELGHAGFIEVAEAFGDHAIVLFLCRARERQIDAEIARQLSPKIVGDLIAAHSTPIALR